MSDRAVNALSWTIVLIAVLAFVDPWLSYCKDLIALGIAFTSLGPIFVLAY
jgi:hydrogenase-4 membrane subunit HyfE